LLALRLGAAGAFIYFMLKTYRAPADIAGIAIGAAAALILFRLAVMACGRKRKGSGA
jgi:hypothetical protein